MGSDKRFQVFVSSTYLDLRDERQAVTGALLQLDAFPAGMELFPAADDDAWTLIKRVIDDCDYYLLVIGGKYGSVDPVDQVSYTEKEYDYAVSKGKPVMAFLHANPDEIPVGKTDKSSDAAKRLDDFRGKVKRAKHVKFWNNAEHLAGQVALSFAQFTKQYPAVGWIRADQQASPELLAELNTLRKKITELEGELEISQTGPPSGTEHLSQSDDIIAFVLGVKATWKGRKLPYESRKYSDWHEVNMTWDGIFGGLSAKLLDECEEGALHWHLNSWAFDEFWHTEGFDSKIKETIEAAGVGYSTGRVTDAAVEFDDTDFGTVLIQLCALGLIEKSLKKRSVNDTRTYWTLTRYGQDRAFKLRAVPRNV